MFQHLTLLAAFCSLVATAENIQPVLRTTSELNHGVLASPQIGSTFDIEATLVDKNPINLTFQDAFGASCASTHDENICRLKGENGNLIRVRGYIAYENRFQHACAICTNLTILDRGSPTPPLTANVPELLGGKFDFRLVSFKGTVRNLSTDEIDTRFVFLLVDGDGATIPAVLSPNDAIDDDIPIGSLVEITGICNFGDNSVRRMPGRMVTTHHLTVLSRPEDPFNAPSLGDLRQLIPAEIAALGRRRATGVVLAAFSGKRFIIKSKNELIHTVQLASGPTPSAGDFVTAVGYPESDLYHTHLTHAIWRRERTGTVPADQSSAVNVKDILKDHTGHPGINPKYHGATIRLYGTIADIRHDELRLRCDSELILVDTTSCPDVLAGIEVGSEAEITGVCLMDVERWHPNDIFPHIRGFSIALRSPTDVRILVRPPWWTPVRLGSAIAILLSVLTAILVWNMLLRRLSERRGRELAEEKVALVESELKSSERTRLAVELHDSIAQSLIGAAMEIKAAKRFSESDPSTMKAHLSIAEKTIDSCRQDIKNCIYDLRSNALEEEDLNDAIRQALDPHLGKTKLSMRFNIPRKALSVNTLHAFIRIIRELTINAIRHGHANSIWIAGSIDGDTLKFSVRDDGGGFDPKNCPGMEDGHFGLQGIKERVKQFDGSFTLERLSPKGMKATISIKTAAIK